MKNAVSFIFAAVCGAVLLSACGGGGGGGFQPPVIIPPIPPINTPPTINFCPDPAKPVLDGLRCRARIASDCTGRTPVLDGNICRARRASDCTGGMPIFENGECRGDELFNPAAGVRNDPNSAALFNLLNAELNRGRNVAGGNGITLSFSTVEVEPVHRLQTGLTDIVVNGGAAGDRYTITITGPGGSATVTLVVFEQNSVLYAANTCGSADDPTCEEEDINGNDIRSPRQFTWSGNNYTITNVFYFNRGLIENAARVGNFYINAENMHAEYRWTPYSDVFIDGGFRRFGDADVVYGKLQADYNDFYLQYTLGNLRSNYYQSGKIDGIAFGWQKDGFAAKAEKPVGNDGKAWFRLFYKTDL